MEFKSIIMSIDGEICTITLNRPEQLNAISLEMMEELFNAVTLVAKDNNVRVLIITGEGRAFCAGADMKLLEQIIETKAGFQFRRVLRDEIQRAVNCIEHLEKPVIAAINGFATGGGAEIALACDFRISSEQARFIFTEVKIGAIPDAGGIPRLTRLLGYGKAKELIMLARSVDGREAERIGLVNKCVSHDNLIGEAGQWAEDLLKCAPLAVGAAKRVIDLAMNVDLMTALDLTGIAQNELFNSEDADEAVQAFSEKRKPVFKGK